MKTQGVITAFYGAQLYPEIKLFHELWTKDAPDGVIYYSHECRAWYQWYSGVPRILHIDDVPNETKLWAMLLGITF